MLSTTGVKQFAFIEKLPDRLPGRHDLNCEFCSFGRLAAFVFCACAGNCYIRHKPVIAAGQDIDLAQNLKIEISAPLGECYDSPGLDESVQPLRQRLLDLAAINSFKVILSGS